MNWSNLVFLGVGVLLGAIAASWRSVAGDRQVENSTATPPPSPKTDSEVQPLLKQLKQLQLDYQLATEMAQFKAGFLARVSHEVRSPLNGIIGAHQIILADLCNDTEEERDFLRNANESALKMVDMLEEILKVSRIEQGKMPLRLESFPLEDIFEEVYGLTYLQAANSNYPFNITFPDSQIQIRADFKVLRQILVYVIETAISNMEEGSLNLSSQCLPNQNWVCVWLDSPCSHEAWSDPVDLLQSEPKSAKDGPPKLSPGMGLTINQTLLEFLGGRLEILAVPSDADPNHITRIQCSLPLATSEPKVE